MRKRLQIFLGLGLVVATFVGVLLFAQASQLPTYEVAVVIKEVPAYTPLAADMLAVDSQSVSAAVAGKYVLADDLNALLAAGAVTVENLHPGQPLLRVQVASGARAETVSRLAVALTDPSLVILAVPVVPNSLPAVFPGDVIALFYASGSVQATTIQTSTLVGPTPTPTPLLPGVVSETITVTTQLDLPLAKWIANGVVYRVNHQLRDNPNYGAPGATTDEPRYIEGDIQSLDIVVRRTAAEWVAFALANGHIQVGVLPAITRPNAEAGNIAHSRGVTWSDFEQLFFADRK
jgi:hypothetical protein